MLVVARGGTRFASVTCCMNLIGEKYLSYPHLFLGLLLSHDLTLWDALEESFQVSFLRCSTQIPNSRHSTKNVRAKVQIVFDVFPLSTAKQKIHVVAVWLFYRSYLCTSQSHTPV